MPVKKEKKPLTDPGRRTFLSRIWMILGLAALAELVAGGLAFFVSGRKKDEDQPDRIVDAGEVAKFLPGTVTLVREANCYLSCLDDGSLLAISRRYTHLGCAVPWVAERNRFECPCHASIFDRTGQVVQSPAPRALDLFRVRVKRNIITIDITRPIKRSTFSSDQLTYPREQG